MARYLEAAREIKPMVDSFLRDHPEVKDDTRFAQIVYDTLKPSAFRAQVTVKRAMVKAILGDHYKLTEREFPSNRGGTFTGLVIEKKVEPSPFD